MKIAFQKVLKFIGGIPFPVLLLGVSFLTYGLFFLWQGFYLDDWYIVYTNQNFGAQEFLQFFRNDRPFFAYLYMIFVPIFQDSRVAWQLFDVFTRFLASLTFWVLLLKLLPNRRRLAAIAALLFTVYPGFQFHWFAVMYSQFYVMMCFYFLSYILMIDAVRASRRKVLYIVGAILCLVVGIVPSEYLYGLELVRPIILWVVLEKDKATPKLRLKKTVLNWLPYLAFFMAFTAFRILFGQSYSYKIELLSDLKSAPLDTLLGLAGKAFWSVYDSLVNAWVGLTGIFKRDMLSTASILMLVVVVLGYLITRAVFNRNPDEPEKGDRSVVNMIWIGLFATLVGLIPFMAASYEVSLEFPYNRFLIALAPGASLVLTGLVEWLIRAGRQKAVLFGLCVGLAMGSQFLAARSFMIYWQQQTDFFRQLSWRAPALQENTALVTAELPFSKYFSGGSLTAPLNLIYGKDQSSKQLSTVMLLVSSPQKDAISALLPGKPINYAFRTLSFEGSTDQMIAFYQPTKGCLRLLSAADSQDEFAVGHYYDFWHDVLPLSNLGQIDQDPANAVTLDTQLFGKENKEQWCYYYEKASLASQNKDWPETLRLYEQAYARGFYPLNNSEYIPQIQAYLNLDKSGKALALVKNLPDVDSYENASICKLLKTFQAKSIEAGEDIAQALSVLQCGTGQ